MMAVKLVGGLTCRTSMMSVSTRTVVQESLQGASSLLQSRGRQNPETHFWLLGSQGTLGGASKALENEEKTRRSQRMQFPGIKTSILKKQIWNKKGFGSFLENKCPFITSQQSHFFGFCPCPFGRLTPIHFFYLFPLLSDRLKTVVFGSNCFFWADVFLGRNGYSSVIIVDALFDTCSRFFLRSRLWRTSISFQVHLEDKGC